MQIDHYSFGRIEIDGHSYDADVIVFPDHIQERWWRQEGHRLTQEDLETVLADKPQILVIGTGYYGRMQVPDETREVRRLADFLRDAETQAEQVLQSASTIGAGSVDALRLSTLPTVPRVARRRLALGVTNEWP